MKIILFHYYISWLCSRLTNIDNISLAKNNHNSAPVHVHTSRALFSSQLNHRLRLIKRVPENQISVHHVSK